MQIRQRDYFANSDTKQNKTVKGILVAQKDAVRKQRASKLNLNLYVGLERTSPGGNKEIQNTKQILPQKKVLWRVTRVEM